MVNMQGSISKDQEYHNARRRVKLKCNTIGYTIGYTVRARISTQGSSFKLMYKVQTEV